MQELVTDMDSVEQQSWARLADWMKQRYHGECSAVSALHKLASQAAFAGHPLPYQLDLQVPSPPSLRPAPRFLLCASTSSLAASRLHALTLKGSACMQSRPQVGV